MYKHQDMTDVIISAGPWRDHLAPRSSLWAGSQTWVPLAAGWLK